MLGGGEGKKRGFFVIGVFPRRIHSFVEHVIKGYLCDVIVMPTCGGVDFQ